MTTWRYQATHHTVNGEDVYEVREVYAGLATDGSLSWTEDAIAPVGETRQELVKCLEMMLADVKHWPVLEIEDGDA